MTRLRRILCLLLALGAIAFLCSCKDKTQEPDLSDDNAQDILDNQASKVEDKDTSDASQPVDWRENVTDSGYECAYITRTKGDMELRVKYDEYTADVFAYLASLLHDGSGYRPKTLTWATYVTYNVVMEKEDGSRDRIEFVDVEKNNSRCVGIMGDSITWLSDDALTVFDELLSDISSGFDSLTTLAQCDSMVWTRYYENGETTNHNIISEWSREVTVEFLHLIQEVDSDDNYVISDADAGDFCTIKVKVYPSITKEYLESLNLYYANQPSKGLRKLGVSRDAVHIDWLTDEVIDWFEDYVIQKSKAHMLYPDNQSEYTINKAARLRSMPDIFGELTALQAAEILYEDILREFSSYSTKRPYTIAGYDKLVMSAERWGDYWEVRDYTEYKFNGTRPGMELLFYGAVLTKTNGIWYLDTAQKGGGDIALARPVSLSGRYDTATLTRNVYKTKDYTNSAHEELRPVGVRVWDKDYTFQLTDRYDVDALLDIVCDTAPDRDDADILNAAYSNNSRDFVHIQVVLDGSQGGAEFTLVYASPYTEIRGWENRTLTHALGIKHDEGIIWLTDRAIDRFEEICGRNGINADNFLFCDNQLRGNFAEEQFILGLSDPNGDYEPMQAAERLYRIMVDICSESDPKRTYVITEIKELKLGIEEYGDTSRVYDYGTVLEFDGVLSSVHNGGFIVDMGGYFDYIDGVWYLSTYYGFEAFLDQATVF